MLYLWQLTCAFGSVVVAFAVCVSDAVGPRRIWPFTRDWGVRSYQTLENGKKEPCLRSLEILAAGFELSLSQLLSRL